MNFRSCARHEFSANAMKQAEERRMKNLMDAAGLMIMFCEFYPDCVAHMLHCDDFLQVTLHIPEDRFDKEDVLYTINLWKDSPIEVSTKHENDSGYQKVMVTFKNEEDDSTVH